MIHDGADPSLLGTMAPPTSNYLTEDAYIEHRWAQDDLIRKEFERHYNHVETRHHELRAGQDLIKADVEELKVGLDGVKADVEELKVGLDGVKADVEQLKVGLSRVEADVEQLKGDVRQLKVDVAELKVDVAELKVDVAELKVAFQRMEGQNHNRSIHNMFQRITPIGVYQLGKGLVMPVGFPKYAFEFWKLKAPRTESKMDLLIYLVRFYDVQGYETWKYIDARTNSQNSDDDSDSESDSESSPDMENSQLSLEDAVRAYPHIAVEELASIVGLVEANFESFRARAAEYGQRPRTTVAKRHPEPVNHEPAKRQDTRLKREPVSVAPVFEQRPTIPLEQLIASPKSKSSEPATELSQVEWDNRSALEEIQKILNRAKQEKSKSHKSTPEAKSKSPKSAVSAVQLVLDQYHRKSASRNSAEAFPGSPTEINEKSPRVEASG